MGVVPIIYMDDLDKQQKKSKIEVYMVQEIEHDIHFLT